MKTKFMKTLIIALAIIAALFLTEFALRLTTHPTFLQSAEVDKDPQWIVYDPILGWINRAGYQGREFRINSLGFRGDEVSKSKPDGTIRILTLGDSGTFGFWESWPKLIEYDSYTDVLREELLVNGHQRVEVINAGVLGYTSANGVRLFMTKGVELDPDIITLRFTHNDYIRVRNPDFYIEEPLNPLARWLVYNLDDWRLVRLYARIAQKLGIAKAMKREHNVTPLDFKKNMETVINEARARDIEVLLIDYPLSEQEVIPISAYRHYIRTSDSKNIEELRVLHDKYQDALKEAAQENRVPLLETQPIFSEHKNTLFSRNDIIHPNNQGAKMIGKLLYQKFLELGWVNKYGKNINE